MARATIADLANEVRSLVMVDKSEFQIGTVNFWDDDQIQIILDKNRQFVIREELIPIQKHVGGGSVEYYEYHSRFKNFEQTQGGTAILILEDSTGTDIGTASYTFDYKEGIATFGSNTGGSSYYLTGRSYNLFSSAAQVARGCANYYATAYNISTDGHRLDRSQIRKNYLDMATEFESMEPVQTLDFNVD